MNSADNGRPSCSRISRIAQPKRTSSLAPKRSLSAVAERTNIQTSSGNYAYAKRPRSVSATPIKTPTKHNYHQQYTTPLRSASRNSAFYNSEMGSVNIEINKKMIGEHSARILKILRSDLCTFGHDFLSGGLRTISAKQFYMVISFFMKRLIGRNIIGANPPDDIVKFLTTINYPYTITKSLLKTPNIPTAYPIIVEILSWLCDLIDVNDTINEFEHIDNILMDNKPTFPDQEYTKIFWDNVKDTFHYWNDCEEEKIEQCCNWLKDEFIRKKLSTKSIKSLNDLRKDISRQEHELQNLMQQNYQQIEQEKDKKLTKLQFVHEQMTDKYDDMQLQLKQFNDMEMDKLQQITEAQNEIKLIELDIAAQKYSIDDLKVATKLNNELIEQITGKRNIINEFKDKNFPIEIAIAQKQKQLIEMIEKSNSFIQQFIDICTTNDHQLFDNNDVAQNLIININIRQISDEHLQEIDKIVEKLQKIQIIFDERKAEKLREIAEIENEEQVLAHECEQLTNVEIKLNIELEDLREESLNMDMKIMNEKHLNEIQVNECNQRCADLTIQLNKKHEQIEEKKSEQLKLIQENDEICARVKEKAKEMLAARRQDLDKAKLALNEFRNEIQRMTEEAKKF